MGFLLGFLHTYLCEKAIKYAPMVHRDGKPTHMQGLQDPRPYGQDLDFCVRAGGTNNIGVTLKEFSKAPSSASPPHLRSFQHRL